MKKIVTLMAAASVFAVANSANAFEYTPYVGLDYTHSIANTENFEGFKPDYDGVKVNVGTEFNRFFGTEAFYQATDTDNKNFYGDKLKTKFQAYGLDLMGYLPLYGCEGAGELSAIGTAGIGIYNFKAHVGGYQGTAHEEGVGYRVGAGLQYKVTDNFAIRGIARYVGLDKVDNLDIDHMMEYSAGIKYGF